MELKRKEDQYEKVLLELGNDFSDVMPRTTGTKKIGKFHPSLIKKKKKVCFIYPPPQKKKDNQENAREDA